MLIQKRVASPGSSVGSVAFSGACKLQTSFPAMTEFLTATTWGDGTSRVSGTITLLLDGPILKAALNDRDSGCSCFVAGQSLTDLFKAVEAVLVDGKGDWRAKQPFPSRGRGKGA